MKEVTLPVGLLELNENELFYLLGEQLPDERRTDLMALDGFEWSITAAKDWMDKNRQALRERICGHPVVKAISDDSNLNNKRLLLFLTLADLIASTHTSIGPFVPAALILKQGLVEFCKG